MRPGTKIMVLGGKHYAMLRECDLKALRAAKYHQRNGNPWAFRNLMKRCDMTILEPFSLAIVLQDCPHGYQIQTTSAAREVRGWVVLDSITDDPCVIRRRINYIPKEPIKRPSAAAIVPSEMVKMMKTQEEGRPRNSKKNPVDAYLDRVAKIRSSV